MMSRATCRLAAATTGSALLAIGASIGVGMPAAAIWLFKPLTTALVMAHAWQRTGGEPGVRAAVLLGLILSLVGDVALIVPAHGFLPGLVAFLLAHLAYLGAFLRVAPPMASAWPFAAYAVVAAGLLVWLWPGIPGPLHAPVVAYVVCLTSMAAQAAAVWRRAADDAGARRGAVLALGGLAFVTSDALLAVNKFGGGLPLAPLAILSTYWLAQWCIASWLPPGVPRPGPAATSP